MSTLQAKYADCDWADLTQIRTLPSTLTWGHGVCMKWQHNIGGRFVADVEPDALWFAEWLRNLKLFLSASVCIPDKLLSIWASVNAGVTRFIPSEFGNDSANPNVRKLPVFVEKIKTQDYLVETVSRMPNFSYTFLYTNSFFDWQLKIGFMVNLKEHTATLYDGGDVLFSATRLSTIGKALVAIVHNLEFTENRHIYVHDAAVTQSKLIDLVKTIDGTEWTTTTVSTADVENNAYKLLQGASQADLVNASLGFIARACWGTGYSGDFTNKVNNEVLIIPLITHNEIENMVKQILREVQ